MALITGRVKSLDMDGLHVQYDSQPATPDHHGKSDTPTTPREQKSEEEQFQSSITTPRISKPKNHGLNPSKKPLIQLLDSITPKEINSTIISSENTRVMCSTIIAVLVVLSHVNLPHNVVRSKSLIAYRPLYVVLVTDVLIVAARLALYTQKKREEEDHKGGVNWGGAIKMLELGLVVHRGIRAIFIDCSFYLVIVVCGLSLV
ncbi:hypothetical protein F511_35836 [Dorcoceras hygrometricum]|uniref:Uncharacterized protein n=1 Tax=Dorcoceras hygrometricum TaxID=472368 RepID=A0A2Z7ABA9_9LAMI|nr:hypothetical protein F511_35836 [Dorcoceras hygrometricum]